MNVTNGWKKCHPSGKQNQSIDKVDQTTLHLLVTAREGNDELIKQKRVLSKSWQKCTNPLEKKVQSASLKSWLQQTHSNVNWINDDINKFEKQRTQLEKWSSWKTNLSTRIGIFKWQIKILIRRSTTMIITWIRFWKKVKSIKENVFALSKKFLTKFVDALQIQSSSSARTLQKLKPSKSCTQTRWKNVSCSIDDKEL